MQEVVDCVVGQISAIAAPGSRLCLDLIPRGLLEGRVKPTRGFTNGRDVRPHAPMVLALIAPAALQS